MQKIITINYPKCNNNQMFYKYSKDKSANQKYQCLDCKHPSAPVNHSSSRGRKYLSCPKCAKASFFHHDYHNYSNYRCWDK